VSADILRPKNAYTSRSTGLQWRVIALQLGSAELQEALDIGWEPFGAIPIGGKQSLVHLRIKTIGGAGVDA